MKKVAVVHWKQESVRGKVLKRFDSIEEAEAFICEVMAVDCEGVLRGDYSIDAPEEMVNPV